MRIGHGFDAHPLVPGRPCVLGGVAIDSPEGPDGHSDGDVVLHALADALLGAVAGGDLGSVFGTSDPRFHGVSSSVFVREAWRRAGNAKVGNVDVTLVGSRPRVGPYVGTMRAVIADLLEMPVERVSVKASSGNGLTDFGRGLGVSATVVLLLEEA
ncbi:MAG: 2-C-methyl-D-erythritol 2,4-cyclodiphosphate synthase [Acidobacteria bacterium]|nr:2-C-methyl-D-erythritol 2,4-cyclodiphosphate synthase [Acidobacteriota bacterium]